MNFLRKHWYDLAGPLSIVVLAYILINFHRLTNYQLIMWVSLITLFLHQLEEYRIAGTFPGMVNTALYKSNLPDRYPLNSNTAFLVNVVVGWTFYALAALVAEKAIWLGIATILVSVGNTTAHTILFNIKGKTLYNAGMLTSLLLFIPCIYFFFTILYREQLATGLDFLIGIPLGIVVNVFGVLKPIKWMANKDSPYIFDDRNLLPKDRKKNHS